MDTPGADHQVLPSSFPFATAWGGYDLTRSEAADLTAKAPSRILVVDDDDRIRSTLSRGLAFEGYRIVLAGTGEEGLAKVADHLPDLVVLDIMLPGVDGLEVTRRLRASRNDVPILLLTARDEVQDRVTGLEAGADDYVVKPFSLAEVLARVGALLRRRPSPTEPLCFGDLELDAESCTARRGGRSIHLTTTEAGVLRLFMRRPQEALSRMVILEHVWEGVFDGEPRVADLYVQSLRNKLEAAGEPRLIHVIGEGDYVLRTEPG